ERGLLHPVVALVQRGRGALLWHRRRVGVRLGADDGAGHGRQPARGDRGPMSDGPDADAVVTVVGEVELAEHELGVRLHGGPPGSVESIEYSFHSPSGSLACRTAISRVPTVPVSLMNRIVENHVVVAGSYQQRGSLVNSLPPTLYRSLMLNGPRTDLPFVRKM